MDIRITIVQIILAVIPGLALGFMVYKLDRIDKEPFLTLLKLFMFGAISIVPAIVLEILGEEFLGFLIPESSILNLLIEYFIVVACAEELGKYVALNTMWRKSDFNYVFDAVVYSVMVTLGFAVFENITYALRFPDQGFSTVIMRAFTAIPGHTIFGIYMGHHLGLSKYWLYHDNLKKCKLHRTLAYIVPVILHGAYDSLASLPEFINKASLPDNLVYYRWVFIILSDLAFFAFIIATDVVTIVKLIKYSKRDTPIAPWDSSVPVVGWFPEDTIDKHASNYVVTADGDIIPAPPKAAVITPQQMANPQGTPQGAPQAVPGRVIVNPAMQQPTSGRPILPNIQVPPLQQNGNPAMQQFQNRPVNPAVQQVPNRPGNPAMPNSRPVVPVNAQGQPVPQPAPKPIPIYKPSRAYAHAQAHLENMPTEGYSLNSFVEKDPSDQK